MHRDLDLIRRDIQIARITADNVKLMAENQLLRANLAADELRAVREETLARMKGFEAELALAMREAKPIPPATPPSGEPLRVATDLGPTEAPGT